MTDNEFTEQLIALARRRYGELPHDNLLRGIQNTLTLALAHAVADSVHAQPGEERGAIVLGMQAGIQYVRRQVLSSNTPARTWQ